MTDAARKDRVVGVRFGRRTVVNQVSQEGDCELVGGSFGNSADADVERENVKQLSPVIYRMDPSPKGIG